MKRKLQLIIIATLLYSCFYGVHAYAQEENPSQEFLRGKVLQIQKEGEKEVGGYIQPFQHVVIQTDDAGKDGKKLYLEHGGVVSIEENEKVKEGENVVLAKVHGVEKDSFFIIDKYRLTPIIIIALIFLLTVFIFAGIKGLSSIVGLVFSVLILALYIVPRIIAGADPLLTSLTGATVITCVSIFLAHGFKKRTVIAVVSTLLLLVTAAITAVIFVSAAKLFGTGSDAAYAIQLSALKDVDLRGLLLGGIIIGVLGVLDDVTTAQAAAVDEIHKANPKLTFKELYARGMSVGKEHMVSMVNTLVLAYAGVSLPLFLLFTLNEGQPLWVIFNSEFIAEEIIRTLVGSLVLILAVPFTTLLTTYVMKRAPHRF